ncbi:MAG TPA: RluA family pseudouridine synthase [Puia sp.]|nr:RluA family pseudouridine synthase [Puia sp.]
MQQPDILFENNDFVAVNKPAGLLSIPDREGKDVSLKKILKDKYGDIFTVHRLDRGTSGVIVFAKNEATHKYLSKIFEERDVEKIYQGIVHGTLPGKKGSIDSPIMEHPAKPGVMVINKKGKASLTDFEVLEELGLYSFVQFQIHTGRTHQIRVHMQSLGHPIACDEVYGEARPIFLSSFKRGFKLSKAEEQERPMLNRLALHSHLLHFQDEKGEYHTFEAPLAKDMKALLQQLRKWKT